jgi:lipopolysaccharide/colanic/teichoic acid biosynthesis glycosyltransferase
LLERRAGTGTARAGERKVGDIRAGVVTADGGLTWASGRGDSYCRAFDIVVSAVLAIVTLPIVVVAALGSAIALRAWPFFSQDRVGKDGALFRFLKVRTLPTAVPTYIDKHHLVQDDIPAFCRLLRTLHLDELPQLYLVLAGRMSLVGPRPEMAYLHDGMQRSFASLRTSVRPGCTGLWQISTSCTELISEAPEYDAFYLTHRSLRLDLWVLGRTALRMTGIAGCVTLDDVPTWVVPAARRTHDVVVDLASNLTIDLRDAPIEVLPAAGYAPVVGR